MKTQRILAAICASVLMVGAVACAPEKRNDTNSSSGQEAANPVTFPEEHFVTNSLHKVKVAATDRAFVTNGKTDYVIAVGEGEKNFKAATFIKKHLLAATGAAIDIVSADTVSYSSDAKLIVVNDSRLFAEAKLTLPDDDIGQTGYYIGSCGNSVFIAVRDDSGAQYGAIAFLRYTVGYVMYADNCVSYSNKGETLPDFDVVEKPDFEFYVQGNSVSSQASYGMGFMTTAEIFIPVEGETWHNSLNYLPPSTYQSEHPDWYADTNNELCYTAHGNEEEFNAMCELVASKMIGYAAQYPERNNITLTIEDHQNACSCEACSANLEKYNGANSASVVKFMNKVNELVQSELQKAADEAGTEKRQLNLLFFAYNKMEKAPAVKVNGEYQPIDESVKLAPEVGVYIAPITAAYNRSFYDETNSGIKSNIEAWASCSDKLYMWLYETNYSHYLYPLNTYDTMIETYRFCKAGGAMFMMNEGQYNQGNVTHFSKLKEYFNSRALFDVNVNYADIVNDFFENYFGAAEEPMRCFFDELQAHLRKIEAENPEINGNIYNNMAQTKLWQSGTLLHWLDLINEAYAAIEPLKAAQSALYDSLAARIKLESIFPRYAMLSLYGGMYTSEQLYSLRTQFREDCTSLRITMLNETTSLDSVYSSWKL